LPYISEPVEFDVATIDAEIRAALTAAMPALILPPGTGLDILIRSFAPLVAENRQMLTEQLAEAFQYAGEKIFRVPRQLATQATGLADFTIGHTNGYEIPAGTEISLDKGDGTRVAFATRTLTVIPNGQSTALDVEVVAVEAGAAGSGVSGDALVEQPFLADVATVTVSPATTGGVDEENATAYLDRLAETTPLLAFTLVNSADFERDARNEPLIDRALVIPGYKADTGTPNQGGHFTVAVEQGGADPGAPVRSALQARQQAMVPPNVVVWVIAPTFTDIDVVFAAKRYAEFDTADVETRAEQAILDFLNPARFGLPQAGDVPLWLPQNKVRYTDLIAVLEGVIGLETIVGEGTATTTNGSPNLTLVTPTNRWVNGQRISGAGIPAGARILSGAGTATMIMTLNATASAAGVAITGAALAVNGGVDDVTLSGVAPLPGPAASLSAAGTVS
jgi:uncharacterized phage protein gp47/JayE